MEELWAGLGLVTGLVLGLVWGSVPLKAEVRELALALELEKVKAQAIRSELAEVRAKLKWTYQRELLWNSRMDLEKELDSE